MEQSQIYQEQKFGQRVPKKFIQTLYEKSICNQEIESPQLVEIIPKMQICFSKVVLTDTYALIFTFNTFTIKFGNFIRKLNFEETTQLMHLESIELINKYLQENLQINQNENIHIKIEKHQDMFSKYQIPLSPIVLTLQDIGVFEIHYPKLEAYFQFSSQTEEIQLTNSDVLHLIGNNFSTIQQYSQRINFGKQRSYVRQFHDLRIKEIGVDIYDQSTFKQLQIKQSKHIKDLNQKILKQVCETDQKYVILTLHPPQLVLKQLKKTIFKQSFTLLEFIHMCFMLQKVQLETFLIMIKLQKQNGKYRFVYNLNEYPIGNELSQTCLRNGLFAKINKSIQYDLNYFKLEYVPFRIIIYDPLEVKEYEMPVDFNVIEQMITLKLNVEFKIY
ncbi:unnamed protein product [Paramecium sonneborni]|uniref:Uncharacterized protein n=1 Tax=Paramecium sonneborni TaxID=65129 RepID=A0A8S1KVH8_9CILI|nr:unnamed protein product [Paramecium sonneborni]